MNLNKILERFYRMFEIPKVKLDYPDNFDEFYPEITDEMYIKLLLLKLYLLTRNGTQFLISGKILTRVCKVFRRYQCMSNGKNIIPKYHRDLLTNLSYIEKTFDFFYMVWFCILRQMKNFRTILDRDF